MNNPPVHQICIGCVRAAIWANVVDDRIWYSVTFERSYRHEGTWRHSDTYRRDDLLTLAKVADLAHTWIAMAPRSPQPQSENHDNNGRQQGVPEDAEEIPI